MELEKNGVVLFRTGQNIYLFLEYYCTVIAADPIIFEAKREACNKPGGENKKEYIIKPF